MSFGSGEAGQLGHGDAENQHPPKLIEALLGKGLQTIGIPAAIVAVLEPLAATPGPLLGGVARKQNKTPIKIKTNDPYGA